MRHFCINVSSIVCHHLCMWVEIKSVFSCPQLGRIKHDHKVRFLTGINHHHSVVFHVFPSSSSSAPLVQRRKSRKCLVPIAEVPYSFLIDAPSTRFLIPSYPKLLLQPHTEGFVSGWDKIKGKERDACMHVINRNLQKKFWWFAVLHNIQFGIITKIKLIEEQPIQTNWLSSGMWTY